MIENLMMIYNWNNAVNNDVTLALASFALTVTSDGRIL
jgi:hypothetical protein